MKTKYSFYVGLITALIIAGMILATAIFEKLENYKKEISRLHSYHSNVIQRHDEDIGILFMRLNKLEAIQQGMAETVDRLDWLSKHRY